MKLQATILLLETREIACGNAVILSPKLLHQSSVLPCSTNNRNNKTESILNIIGLCFRKESVFLMYFDCVPYLLCGLVSVQGWFLTTSKNNKERQT